MRLPDVRVADVTHGVNAGGSRCSLGTAIARPRRSGTSYGHEEMILATPIQTLARYASSISLLPMAVHDCEQRPQEHDTELGR